MFRDACSLARPTLTPPDDRNSKRIQKTTHGRMDSRSCRWPVDLLPSRPAPAPPPTPLIRLPIIDAGIDLFSKRRAGQRISLLLTQVYTFWFLLQEKISRRAWQHFAMQARSPTCTQRTTWRRWQWMRFSILFRISSPRVRCADSSLPRHLCLPQALFIVATRILHFSKI